MPLRHLSSRAGEMTEMCYHIPACWYWVLRARSSALAWANMLYAAKCSASGTALGNPGCVSRLCLTVWVSRARSPSAFPSAITSTTVCSSRSRFLPVQIRGHARTCVRGPLVVCECVRAYFNVFNIRVRACAYFNVRVHVRVRARACVLVSVHVRSLACVQQEE